jgi:hypothetical protein
MHAPTTMQLLTASTFYWSTHASPSPTSVIGAQFLAIDASVASLHLTWPTPDFLPTAQTLNPVTASTTALALVIAPLTRINLRGVTLPPAVALLAKAPA